MKDILIEGLLSKYNKLYGSLTEGYAHFEYVSGGNPYIATTEKEKNRILRKYKGRVTEIKPGFYQIDDDPYMGADDGYDTYTSVDDGYDTYVGADDGYDTYTGEEGTYEGIDESCGKKSKKLKESMKEIDRKYFASLNKEEDGHYYILIDGTYEKDFYADSDEEAKKKFQQYLRKNESLKESKDSKDELYKKIAGYVKKYDSGELDIDETVKQILDFWEKSSKDNLNKDIDNAVKKTAHKKKNESLSLKEDVPPNELYKQILSTVSSDIKKIFDSVSDEYSKEEYEDVYRAIYKALYNEFRGYEDFNLSESFWTGSRWQKRIARYDEFDNGNVFHNDWITVPDEEAEEMARQASIETPNKVFFVQYDDPMAEPSSNRYINGKVYDSSAPECTKFGKFSR